mgnify:CR=1 FL=1
MQLEKYLIWREIASCSEQLLSELRESWNLLIGYFSIFQFNFLIFLQKTYPSHVMRIKPKALNLSETFSPSY